MRLKLIEESFNPENVTKVYRAINDGMETDEDLEALKNYLQQIVSYCSGIAKDYNIELQLEEEEDDSSESLTEAIEPEQPIDPPEPRMSKVSGTIYVTYNFETEIPSSWEHDDLVSDIKDNLSEYTDDIEEIEVDCSYRGKQDYADELADMMHDEEMIQDGEEATQPQDIAKKVEYKKMVTPDFKVGSKI